uniref:Flp/Fap pilin component n=1 Tax=Chelativorans sp. (strain BNC1) TaxID=266779 RepID=Q11DZ5_CHESB
MERVDSARPHQNLLTLVSQHGRSRFEALTVKHFLRSSKDGATAVECALIAGILVIAIVAGLAELSRVLGHTYAPVAEDLANAGD